MQIRRSPKPRWNALSRWVSGDSSPRDLSPLHCATRGETSKPRDAIPGPPANVATPPRPYLVIVIPRERHMPKHARSRRIQPGTIRRARDVFQPNWYFLRVFDAKEDGRPGPRRSQSQVRIIFEVFPPKQDGQMAPPDGRRLDQFITLELDGQPADPESKNLLTALGVRAGILRSGAERLNGRWLQGQIGEAGPFGFNPLEEFKPYDLTPHDKMLLGCLGRGGHPPSELVSALMAHAENPTLPNFDDVESFVSWKGKPCSFGHQTEEFRFIKKLIERVGKWVPYFEIGEDCMDDDQAEPTSIRSLKFRVTKKLESAGMGDLAESIKGEKEKYRLKLPNG